MPDQPGEDVYNAAAVIRYWLARARWAIQRVGYWIRPYDTLADRRRWCWQPRTRCGWSGRDHG